MSPQERDPQLRKRSCWWMQRTSSELEVTPALLAAYRETFEKHAGEVEAYCRKYGWGYVRALTEVHSKIWCSRVARGRMLR